MTFRPTQTLCALTGTILSSLFLSTCGTETRTLDNPSQSADSEKIIVRIAKKEGVDERVLLATAYTQSLVGQATTPQLAVQTTRDSIYGMPNSTVGPIDKEDVSANTRLLATKMAELAQASPPESPFDWAVLAAHVIVGEISDDPNVRDLALRAALVEIIEVYNSGFTLTDEAGDTLSLPPLPHKEQISLDELDEQQIRYVNGFRFRRDFGSDFFLAGNEMGKTAEKSGENVPNLLVLWCPASNLVCLEYFRRTALTPVHFLATHTLGGQLETFQFYPVLADLQWEEQVFENTITLAISGQAGKNPQDYAPDWMGFEEYASSRTLIRNIFDQTLRKFLGAVEAERLLADPGFFKQYVHEFTPEWTSESGLNLPEPSQQLSLPYFWDSELFWEVITAEWPPRSREQLLVKQPRLGQVYQNTDVPFEILISEDVAEIQIFQDMSPEERVESASPWELILKREVDPLRRKTEKFLQPFTRPGALAHNHRAVKITARDKDGRLLSSHVVRFAVKNLAEQ